MRDTSQVVTTLGERSDDAHRPRHEHEHDARRDRRREPALAEALDYLPQTLRRGNTTFVNLRATLDDLDKLVAASKPASKNLAPFLAELRPLLQEAGPTSASSRKLLRQPGADNDFTDLLNSSPALAQQASSTFPASVKALKKGTPVLTFFRPYSPDLVGWFRDFGQSVVQLRRQRPLRPHRPIFNAFSYDQGTNQLTSGPARPARARRAREPDGRRALPGRRLARPRRTAARRGAT